jgi:hypothetical protein
MAFNNFYLKIDKQYKNFINSVFFSLFAEPADTYKLMKYHIEITIHVGNSRM